MSTECTFHIFREAICNGMHCRSFVIKKHKRKQLGIILNVDVHEIYNAAGFVCNISKTNLVISMCRIGNGQMFCVGASPRTSIQHHFDWVPLQSALVDLMDDCKLQIDKETDKYLVTWKIQSLLCTLS